MGSFNDERCLSEAEMTDCVSRIDRSSDVSIESVTAASSKYHQSRARINVTSLMNKIKNTGTYLKIEYWRGGPWEAYLSPRATFERPGACSELLGHRRIPRLACVFHRVAGTRGALGVMGAKKGQGHPL